MVANFAMGSLLASGAGAGAGGGMGGLGMLGSLLGAGKGLFGGKKDNSGIYQYLAARDQADLQKYLASEQIRAAYSTQHGKDGFTGYDPANMQTVYAPNELGRAKNTNERVAARNAIGNQTVNNFIRDRNLANSDIMQQHFDAAQRGINDSKYGPIINEFSRAQAAAARARDVNATRANNRGGVSDALRQMRRQGSPVAKTALDESNQAITAQENAARGANPLIAFAKDPGAGNLQQALALMQASGMSPVNPGFVSNNMQGFDMRGTQAGLGNAALTIGSINPAMAAAGLRADYNNDMQRSDLQNAAFENLFELFGGGSGSGPDLSQRGLA